jgi:hypothetical protein
MTVVCEAVSAGSRSRERGPHVPFKIHPGIGIARIGNSTEKFVGPVTAAEPVQLAGFYKDDHCRQRRQGARFEVWEYNALGQPLGRVDASRIVSWSAQVARTGKTPAPVVNLAGHDAHLTQAETPFAEFESDAQGRLVVYGGVLPDNAFFDDLSGDGFVHATVSTGKSEEAALAAWVVLGPPDFAPAMRPLKSVYDKISQLLSFNGDATTSYRRHVYPILRAGSDLKTVRGEAAILTPAVSAQLPLLSGQAARQQIKDLFTGPFSLTAQQAQRLADWVSGPPAFVDDSADLNKPLDETPLELDKGQLDHCLQEGTGWDMGSSVTSQASAYLEPFRLDPNQVTFGFTRTGLAADWPQDLAECTLLWPAQTTILKQTNESPSWATRGFVERDASGNLFLDEQCGTLKHLDFNFEVAGRRVLAVLGGGLGDGVVVVMGPNGPIIIGPGDPLFAAIGTAAHRFQHELVQIAIRAALRKNASPAR